MRQDEYRVLRARVHGPSYQLNELILPYLDVAGFGTTTLIRMFELRVDLISTLVERLCVETHTITLEDVALQLGLPVNGVAVTGSSKVIEPVSLYY
ncbi:hypothetical protein PVK06_048614 [Gossypium arboreum]|uniref:Uncharacterized protein n=1 Tax=Gossypium arboreum TaxID=29729 RepID=A0ABR0MGG4_GOSAR|nr:hypothetical protein PVK06_048614 [Gossypium arboreum]